MRIKMKYGPTIDAQGNYDCIHCKSLITRSKPLNTKNGIDRYCSNPEVFKKSFFKMLTESFLMIIGINPKQKLRYITTSKKADHTVKVKTPEWCPFRK